MICNRCGNQCPDGSTVCSKCGAQLVQYSQQPQQVISNEMPGSAAEMASISAVQPKEKKKKEKPAGDPNKKKMNLKKGLIIGGAAVAAVAVVVGGVFLVKKLVSKDESKITIPDNLFSDDRVVVRANGTYMIADTSGDVVVTSLPDYDRIDSFHEGLAIVKSGGKFGLIDINGKEVVPATSYTALAYDAISKKYIAGLNYKYGVLNEKGETIIQPVYDQIGEIRENMVPVKNNGMWQYVNTSGELAIPMTYYNAGPFEGGVAVVKKLDGNGFSYINTSGQEVIPGQTFRTANQFVNGYASVQDQSSYKWGLINKEGRGVVLMKYNNIVYPTYNNVGYTDLITYEKYFADKLKLVPADDEAGLRFMNFDGSVAFGFESLKVRNLVSDEKYYPVKGDLNKMEEIFPIKTKSGKYSYINKAGQVQFGGTEFSTASYFYNGVAFCKESDGKYYILKKDGTKALAGRTFSGIYFDESGKFLHVSDSSFQGIVSTENPDQIIVDPQTMKYTEIGQFICDKAVVANAEGKYGIIDATGKELCPCQYREIKEYYDDNYTLARQEDGNVIILDKDGKHLGGSAYAGVNGWGDFYKR